MQCRICLNNENNTTHEVREMMLGLRDMHTYFECSECGCLQIAEIPENIQDYYPSDDYYSYDEIPKILNPKSGYIYSTNQSPFFVTEIDDNLMKKIFL